MIVGIIISRTWTILVLIIKNRKSAIAVEVVCAFDLREKLGFDRGDHRFLIGAWGQGGDPVDRC